MFSFNDIEIPLEEFINNITDEDIYHYYLGDFKDNSWFRAPWRRDTNPSLRISYYNNKWVWVDFGEDIRPKNSIEFIKRYYSVPFREALKLGYKDIIGNQSYHINKIYSKQTSSHCIIRDILPYELEYWNKVEITTEDLKYFNIYSGEIRHNGIIWHTSTIDDPLYIYMWNAEHQIYKGYRPFALNPKFKFYSKNITNHIQGYDKIDNIDTDILIITKSYKDVVVWYKLGYIAIAPHSEVMFIPPDTVEHLKNKFKYIYINYDNDTVGINRSKEFSIKYNLNSFTIPLNTKCKDPFEFVNKYNYNELNSIFMENHLKTIKNATNETTK